MSRVVHFEIAADNPLRAAEFYKDVFGWEIKKWEGGNQDYWLVTTGSEKELGINGGIFKREKPLSSDTENDLIAYRCTIDVSSVDDYMEKVAANGGTVISPKMPIMGIGWLAFCKDTEGNIFGIMKSDMKAK